MREPVREGRQHDAEIIAALRVAIREHLNQGDGAAAFDAAVSLWDLSAGPASAGLLLRAAAADLRSQMPLSIFIARSFTVEPVVPILRAVGARYGLDLTVRIGEFNSYSQELLSAESAAYNQPFDVLILALQTQDIAPLLWSGEIATDQPALEAEVARVTSEIDALLTAFRSRSSATVILNLLDSPSIVRQGVLDQQIAYGQADAIADANRRLRSACRRVGGVYAFDYGEAIARRGRDRWHSSYHWLTSRLPISKEFLADLAQEWTRFLVPIAGNVAKAIVVDLDNTLWGGVVGEDGADGISLSQEYPGAVFVDVQRALKDLARRGILLAICSKNNEADALEVFERHPDMQLRLEDFVVRRINWKDKSTNLREIAFELNIGLDAIAFLDDNLVERRQVRSAVPDVIVLDYPERPDTWAARLLSDPRFERLSVTDEDRRRTSMYRARAVQAEAALAFESNDEFLHALRQTVRLQAMTKMTRARIAQLTQKTNQFNLTTRRYSEQDLTEFDERGLWIAGAHVTDRFGDHGLVAAVVAEATNQRLRLDTMLMSCRVIGRGVETAVLSGIIQYARSRAYTHIDGTFIHTRKNAPARDFYSAHGFALITEDDTQSNWTLDLSTTDASTPPWIALTFSEDTLR